MVEGIIYGFIAAISSMIIFLPISLWFGARMTDFFGINLFHYYIDNFFQVFIIILLAGVALGSISSFLAIRRYLKK